MAWMLNRTAYNWALAQIRAGKVNNSEWDGNKAWQAIPDDPPERNDYADKRFLGINPDADGSNKRARWKFPIAIGDEVYTQALRAVIAAASGARGADKMPEVADAARDLLARATQKKAREVAQGYFALSGAEVSHDVPEWIHIMPFGRYEHPLGSFEITPEIAEQIVANFRTDPRDIVLDYEHQSLNAVSNGQPAPAAGWIKDLEVRDDGIWGRVDWTPEARRYIRNREYRYVSPVYVPEYRDPKTGEVIGPKIISVALTNTPFIPDLKPIVNKTQNQEVEEMERLIALAEKIGVEVTEDLRNDADALEAAIKAKIEELQTKNAGGDAGEPKNDEGNGNDSNDIQMTMTDMAKQIAALQKELIEAKRQIAMKEAAEKVDKLIADGRLLPAQRDWAIQYAMKDPQGFDQFAANLPKMEVPPDVKPNKLVMTPAGSENTIAMKYAEEFGLSEEDLAKYAGDEVKKINL